MLPSLPVHLQRGKHMRPEPYNGDSLREHAQVLRRRKLALALPIIVLPLAALAFSLAQPTRYAASSEVLLTRQNLATSLTGAPNPVDFQQAERYAQTQADLARVPDVARRVLRATNVDWSVEHF